MCAPLGYVDLVVAAELGIGDIDAVVERPPTQAVPRDAPRRCRLPMQGRPHPRRRARRRDAGCGNGADVVSIPRARCDVCNRVSPVVTCGRDQLCADCHVNEHATCGWLLRGYGQPPMFSRET